PLTITSEVSSGGMSGTIATTRSPPAADQLLNRHKRAAEDHRGADELQRVVAIADDFAARIDAEHRIDGAGLWFEEIAFQRQEEHLVAADELHQHPALPLLPFHDALDLAEE